MLGESNLRQSEAEETVVRVPGGVPPPGGWPVLVFLHGCGERAASYAAHAALAAAWDFAGVAPSGPLATAHAGRSWPGELSLTSDCIQAALDGCQADHPVDRGRVYLCGFSQGATHAYGLLAARPDLYRGAIALSPGEGPSPPVPVRTAGAPRALYVAYGQEEYRAFRKRARQYAAMWRRAGWACWLEPHAGWHHFPVDWPTRLPRILQWLQGQGPEGEPSAVGQPPAHGPTDQDSAGAQGVGALRSEAREAPAVEQSTRSWWPFRRKRK